METPEQPGPDPGKVTDLLRAWNAGDAAALDRLLPLVYGELHRIAEGHFRRERPGHTLQPTALVHEAYFRLIDQKRVTWKNRGHFLAVAAQAMRRILIDHARARRREKRGGGLTMPLQTPGSEPGPDVDVLALDEALERLQALDAAQSRIVELRFFGGLTIEETAEVVGVSVASVNRDFRSAKTWLFRELSA